MGIPLTAQEAEKAGLKKASPTEVAKAKAAKGGFTFTPPQLSYICYAGPCSNGRRTICYYTGNGCDNCFTTSEGC